MNSDPETSKSGRPWWWHIIFLSAIVGLFAAIAIPNGIHGGSTKLMGIKNNLRQIDGAKTEWAIEHGVTNAAGFNRAITEKDLAPYLLTAFTAHEEFGNPGFGELYLIRDLNQSPEAVLTRILTERDGSSLPRGTIIRLDQMPGSDNYELIMPDGTSKIYRYMNGGLVITNR